MPGAVPFTQQSAAEAAGLRPFTTAALPHLSFSAFPPPSLSRDAFPLSLPLQQPQLQYAPHQQQLQLQQLPLHYSPPQPQQHPSLATSVSAPATYRSESAITPSSSVSSSSPSPLSAASPPFSRRSKRSSYIYLACDFCRSRKKRCDRQQSAAAAEGQSQPQLVPCSQCKSAKVECVQTATQRAKRQKRKPRDGPDSAQAADDASSRQQHERQQQEDSAAGKDELQLNSAHSGGRVAHSDLAMGHQSLLSPSSTAAEPQSRFWSAASSSALVLSSSSSAVSPLRSPSHAPVSPSASVASNASVAGMSEASDERLYRSSLPPLPTASSPLMHAAASSASSALPSSSSSSSSYANSFSPASLPYPLSSPQSSFALPDVGWSLPSDASLSGRSLRSPPLYGGSSSGGMSPSTDELMLAMDGESVGGRSVSSSPQPSPLPSLPLFTDISSRPSSREQLPRSQPQTAKAALQLSSPSIHPVPSSSDFRLLSSSSTYIATYFTYVSAGVYHHLSEQEFYSQYEAVHVQRSQAMELTWLLCLASVMAIGARMNGDVEYSEYSARQAQRAAAACRAKEEEELAGLGAERLALSYRSLLVLSYYTSAMKEPCDELLDTARRLLRMEGVLRLVPPSVVRLSGLQPGFIASFDRVSSGSASSAAPAASDSSRAPIPASSPLSPRHVPYGQLHPSALAHQAAAYPMDHKRYLKIKRILSSQLSLSADDSELRQDEEWDASLDVTSTLSAKKEAEEILGISLSISEAVQRRHLCQPLPFSLYHALAVLLKAEASVLTLPERGGVFGMKAACYQLLGNTALAVRAARDTVELITQLRSSVPTSLPPFCLSFVRCLAVIGRYDQSEGCAEVICAAMRVLHGVGPLWPVVRDVASELQTALESWTDSEVREMDAELEDSSSQLKQRVLQSIDGRDGSAASASSLVPGAAMTFVQQTVRMQHAHHKRLTVLSLRAKDSGRATAPDAAAAGGEGAEQDGDSEDKKRSSNGGVGVGLKPAAVSLDSQWVVDNLSRLFTRSLELEVSREQSRRQSMDRQ